MNASFEYITSLEYRLKAATAEVMAFKSGEKYVRMQEGYLKELRHLKHVIKNLREELASAHRETVNVRNLSFQTLEDTQKEADRKLASAKRRNRILEERAIRAEKEKNLKLTAQINRDYENSSIPSSKSRKNKKISNSREKSGRKPDGQPGHIEYHADVYYNSKTGEHAHADFPDGVVNDVNYDGSIKAFLFLLNNDCCTSIDKSRKFLSDLTDGKLNISKGMINKLSQEFSEKTEEEQKRMFADMLLSPVMHTDCTNAKVNGKSAYVFVCVTPDGKVLYFARDKKGHAGVKGTPVEDYQGRLVHDHEKAFEKL